MNADWKTGLMAHLGIEFVEVTPDRVLARLKVEE
jgi:acyl-coenzyme A thioesterase PaaI-like protein